MKLTREDADNILTGLGFEWVTKWKDKEVEEFINKLPYIKEGKMVVDGQGGPLLNDMRKLMSGFARGDSVTLADETVWREYGDQA